MTETENNYEEQETLERRRPEPQLIEPQTPQQLKKKLEERQQSFKRTTQGKREDIVERLPLGVAIRAL